MPPDEQIALWAAIRAHPEEDTPRLVYADWLQEHGDAPVARRIGGLVPEHLGPNAARAEFIRVQCALARLWNDPQRGSRNKEWAKEYKPLAMRQNALLLDHKRQWVHSLCRILAGTNPGESVEDWLVRFDFHRGFIRSLRLGLSKVHRLVTSEPVEPINSLTMWCEFHGYQHEQVVALAEWEAGCCVSELNLNNATDAVIHAIVSAGQLARLKRLQLVGGSVSNAGAEELGAAPLLNTLEALSLAENAISDQGAFALAASPHLGGLERLDLHGNPISAPGRQRLRDRFGDRLEIGAEPQ